ncbi:unnamed protein product, partial [marine sediment metagenome]
HLGMRLKQVRDDLEKTAVLAPAHGLLVFQSTGSRDQLHPYELGDKVSQGRPIAQVVNLLHMQVKLEFDQESIIGVKTGQQAIVQVDALPAKTFKGTVVEIGKQARRSQIEGASWRRASDTTFPVTIDLPETKEALMRPGMRANARIIIRRVQNVITVPAECIFERDDRSVVYVERNGRFRRTVVQVGATSGDYTEITSGLEKGQRVALNDLGATAEAETPARPAKPTEPAV